MSRAAGGTYTLPAGNPVVTGTIISSTWGNTTLSDIATALTDSLSRSGLGGMTAPLLIADGTAALPAYSWTNEPSSGFYRIGAGNIGLSVLNRLTWNVTSAGAMTLATPSAGTTLTLNAVVAGLPLSMTDGTVTATATFAGTAFSIGPTSAHTLNLNTNGSTRIATTSAGNVTINAPSSGTTLSVAAVAGQKAISATGAILISADAANNAAEIDITNTGASGRAWRIGDGIGAANGNFTLYDTTAAALRLSVSSAGNVTINAPSSGGALAVAGLTGTNTVNLTSTGAAGALSLGWSVGFGSFWNIYTNSTDGLFVGTSGAASLQLVSNATARAVINSSGTMTINAPAAASPGLIVTGSASTPVNAIGNSSTAFTIDFSRSNVHTVTMTGNVPGGSLTLSNAQDGQTINVFLTQDGTGTRTLGYPASVKWLGGTVGVLSTAINTVDILTLTFRSSTGFYYATLSKAFS